MASQLSRLGASVAELPDGLEIQGGATLSGTEVDSFNDHRIAMSLAVAALRASGSTQVQRAEAAAVSYPPFAQTLGQLAL